MKSTRITETFAKSTTKFMNHGMMKVTNIYKHEI